ncbi:MAG: restriction endonuclease subunit S [Leptothrix sp. (in: b-proteobacteria)]
MSWPTFHLAEIADLVLGKMLDQKKNRGEPAPYLANVNVRWGNFDLSDLREMRFEPHEKDRYGVRRNDIVMCEGGEPGRCAIWHDQVSGMMLQKALHRIRARAGVDPEFLYFSLSGQGRAGQLEYLFTGATIKHLPSEQLAKVEVRLPPLPTQRRIASILGAYDDLIEVNRRRIAVLEEMARRLFEEWFVQFRFPGHECAQAWQAGSVDELISFDPITKLPREGLKPFIPMTHLSTSTSLVDSPEARESGSGAKFKNGDTLFARITPCLENGKTGLVRGLPEDGVGFGSTEFIVMRGRIAGPAFTYLMARHEAFRSHAQKSMSGATGRQRARTESLRAFPFSRPPIELLERFEAQTWPMLELVGQLGEANKRLAASRDLLLPRLISGELEVNVAERELEAVA